MFNQSGQNVGGTQINIGQRSAFNINRPKQYAWKPKKDITAYELALCLPMLLNSSDVEGLDVEGLPEEAKRHFEEINRGA